MGPPDDIEVLFADVEAGRVDSLRQGGHEASWSLPEGWAVEACMGFDSYGHALFRFSSSLGFPLEWDEVLVARLRIRTNDLTGDLNPDTGVTVSPLSVVVSMAQDNAVGDWSAVCKPFDYNFGPTTGNGRWSTPTSPKSFVPVPTGSKTSMLLLFSCFCFAGLWLILRARVRRDGCFLVR